MNLRGVLSLHAAAALLLAGATARAGDLPAAVPLERYQSMLEKSPFAIASQTAPVQPTPEAPGFAKDLVLTGVARLGENTFVSVVSRADPSQRFNLVTGEVYNGIRLASVAWSQDAGATKATLQKGGEYGVIGFDEALLAEALQGNKLPPGAVQTPPGGSQPPNAVQGNAGRPPGVQTPPRPGPRRARILVPPAQK